MSNFEAESWFAWVGYNFLKCYGDTCISFDESHATNSSHNQFGQQQNVVHWNRNFTPIESDRTDQHMCEYGSKSHVKRLSVSDWEPNERRERNDEIRGNKITSNQGKLRECIHFTQESERSTISECNLNWANFGILLQFSSHQRKGNCTKYTYGSIHAKNILWAGTFLWKFTSRQSEYFSWKWPFIGSRRKKTTNALSQDMR